MGVQKKGALRFKEDVKNEGNEIVYTTPNLGPNSMHWAMIRTIQHAIYHTGMISILRHLVGAPRLDKMADTWGRWLTAFLHSLYETFNFQVDCL